MIFQIHRCHFSQLTFPWDDTSRDSDFAAENPPMLRVQRSNAQKGGAK